MTSEAGWYPDPNGRHELRYWDGTSWTEHISNDGVAGNDPVSDATQASPTLADEAVQEAEGRSTPWGPIVAGVAVIALVIGGLVFFLGGDDDGSDSATDSEQLSADSGAAEFKASVGADQAIRFRVTPEGSEAGDLDLALVVAADRGDVVSMGKAMMGDQADGLDDDGVIDRFGLGSLEANGYSELSEEGIDTELIMLGYRDDGGPGEPEADFFVAPDDVELHIITFDLGFLEGEVGFESEKFSGDLVAADQSGLDDEWFSDPAFYGEGFSGSYPFGVGGGLFDDLLDQLPGDLGDLPKDLDGLLGDLPEDFDPETYLADLQDEYDAFLEELPDGYDAFLEDLPDDLDGMIDELNKGLGDFNAEDYFGESGSGLEDFLNDLLDPENKDQGG